MDELAEMTRTDIMDMVMERIGQMSKEELIDMLERTQGQLGEKGMSEDSKQKKLAKKRISKGKGAKCKRIKKDYKES